MSSYLPRIGEYILTYQLENLGLTVYQIGESQVGWREAHFKNIIVTPVFLGSLEKVLNLSNSAKLTPYLLIKTIEIQYNLKNLILRRFRDVYIEGVQGVLSLGDPAISNSAIRLTQKKYLSKRNSFAVTAPDLSLKKTNRIDIKDANFHIVTPAGPFQIDLEVALTDFFSRKVLGNGRISVKSPIGALNGAIKIDKIEHRLWRLTLDVSNGFFETLWAVGSDINSHLEILIAPRNKYINGYIHFSHLTFPMAFKNTLTGFEGDFKYVLDDHKTIKGDVLMKIPQMRFCEIKGHNGHCRLHFSGNFENPFSRLKGNFGVEDINMGSYLKPVNLKGFIRYIDQKLELEGTVNRTPLALNFFMAHHFKNKDGRLSIQALSPLIFKRGGLLLSYFSSKLSDYLDQFEGMVTLKCADEWNKDTIEFSPLITIDTKNVSFRLHDIKVKNMSSCLIFDHFFNYGLIESFVAEKVELPPVELNNLNIQGYFALPFLRIKQGTADSNGHRFKISEADFNLKKKMNASILKHIKNGV